MKKVSYQYSHYMQILSKGQVQRKVKRGRRMKMLHYCRVTQFQLVIWGAEFDEFAFKFDRENVNTRSKSVKLNPIIFFPKCAYLVQLCLRIPKMPFIRMCDNWTCKKCVLKNDIISYTFFPASAQPKIKILLENFACLLLLLRFKTCLPFFDGFEILILQELIS